jgi:hypothetical protein
MTDQLDAARQHTLLDTEAIADQSSVGLRWDQLQHLWQRRLVVKQPPLEQRVQETGEVSHGGDQGAGTRGAGERRVDASQVRGLSVELAVAMHEGLAPWARWGIAWSDA